MNKIRVIDLLNKIAKGEEVPKKIKYDNKYYTYNKEQDDYEVFTICHYDYLLDDINTFSSLNDKVEIIEEKPKHIEEIELGVLSPNGEYIISVHDEKIQDKINELTKAVNYLSDKEKVDEKNK